MAAGQFLLNLADPGGVDLFILVSALVSVAAVPMLLTAVAAPAVIRAPRHRPDRAVPALAPGRGRHRRRRVLATGGHYGIGPVFARAAGLYVALTSAFMAAIMAGGMVLQVPVGGCRTGSTGAG